MIKSKNIRFCKGRAAFLFLAAFLFFLPSLRAQGFHPEQRADSLILFHYPPGVRMFKTKYADNRRSLQLLRERLCTFQKDRDTLYVSGFSGKAETQTENRNIAKWRSNNLKGWLIDHLRLRERDFKTVNYPSAHPVLGEVVILGFSPAGLTTVNGKKTDGIPSQETPPQATVKPATIEEPVIAEKEAVQQKEENTGNSGAIQKDKSFSDITSKTASQPEQESLTTIKAASLSGRYLAVKTNLAAWAGTIMNIAADVQVAGHVSVELPVLWCPWYIGSKHAVKTFAIQPEGRYWLSKPGEGHFFGVHAHVGWFSVKWNRDRYQDTDRPLLGAGISYGYLLPFDEHWAGEFTLGAGYANMKYDTYYNIDNGARIDTRTKNYWGITRVGISVVYRFNLKK